MEFWTQIEGSIWSADPNNGSKNFLPLLILGDHEGNHVIEMWHN
jgi:hypothetical protein